MWDRIMVAAAVGGAALVVGLGAYWAIRQWKLQYRDELRAWLANHPNEKFKTIGLRVVSAADSVAVLVGRVTVAIFGRTDIGYETTITTKTLSNEEAEKLGLIKKTEVTLFKNREIISMRN